MILLLITFLLCLFLSLFFTFVFKRINFTKKNYSGKVVPYAGGAVLLLTICLSLEAYYLKGIISYLKLLFFMLSIFCIYLLGFFEDVFRDGESGSTGSYSNTFIDKILSFNFIKAVVIASVSFFLFYTFNDNYWYLKSIITLLFIYLYNFVDTVPGRCLKLHYFLLLLLNLSYLQWTNELLIISLIAASTYYFFDALSYSMLGKGGSSILGFTAGLIFTEALGTDIYSYVTSAICLLIAVLLLSKISLLQIINNSALLNFFDRLLTEREYKGNPNYDTKAIERDHMDSTFHSE